MTRAVLVGRFQPPHRGHLHAIAAAARKHERVYVGVGSAQHGHEPENPLTVGERFELLVAALDEARLKNVHLYPIPDLHDHARWVEHVEALLPRFDVALSNNPLTQDLFRQAGYAVKPVELWNPDECSGTHIRRRLRKGEDVRALLPRAVATRLARLWQARRIPA